MKRIRNLILGLILMVSTDGNSSTVIAFENKTDQYLLFAAVITGEVGMWGIFSSVKYNFDAPVVGFSAGSRCHVKVIFDLPKGENLYFLKITRVSKLQNLLTLVAIVPIDADESYNLTYESRDDIGILSGVKFDLCSQQNPAVIGEGHAIQIAT